MVLRHRFRTNRHFLPESSFKVHAIYQHRIVSLNYTKTIINSISIDMIGLCGYFLSKRFYWKMTLFKTWLSREV